MRRNIDLNIILFNNEIYGLTKGQYSPTSAQGLRTKSSPQGSIEVPFNPGELALGAKSTFFARIPDTSPKLMTDVFVEAEKHNGTSLVEILQNCVIFNDKVFADITSRDVRDDAQIWLEHGEPMLFGKEKDKGLRLNGLRLEVVNLGDKGVSEKDILIHDAHEEDPTLHMMLVRMERPNFPVAMGVIRQVDHSTYNDRIMEQIKETASNSQFKTVDDLLNSGDTWKIN
jgi:2-oxoglutarate ferredoxin oxidoreductase subunit beta